MKLGEGRIVKEVVHEGGYESGKQSKVGKRPGDNLGWRGLDTEALSGLSMNEVKQVLKDIAWRRARECTLE